MSKQRKVIDPKYIPTKLPIWSTVTTFLALDYWNAPEWLWGALGFLFLIGWIVCIVNIIGEEKFDPFY